MECRVRCPGTGVAAVGVALLGGLSDEVSFAGNVGSRLAVVGREEVNAEVVGTGEAGASGDGPEIDDRSVFVFWRVEDGESEGGGRDCIT